MKRMLVIAVVMALVPAISEARCRSIGESASLGSEYGTFPLYPAERLVEAGQRRNNVALQWFGYGLGVPLTVVSLPFGMVGAGVGAALHPWTQCRDMDGRRDRLDHPVPPLAKPAL